MDATRHRRVAARADRGPRHGAVRLAGEPIADRPDDERERLVEAVRSEIRFLQPFDMRELRAENVVLHDGEPAVADYGLPPGL